MARITSSQVSVGDMLRIKYGRNFIYLEVQGERDNSFGKFPCRIVADTAFSSFPESTWHLDVEDLDYRGVIKLSKFPPWVLQQNELYRNKRNVWGRLRMQANDKQNREATDFWNEHKYGTVKGQNPVLEQMIAEYNARYDIYDAASKAFFYWAEDAGISEAMKAMTAAELRYFRAQALSSNHAADFTAYLYLKEKTAAGENADAPVAPDRLDMLTAMATEYVRHSGANYQVRDAFETWRNHLIATFIPTLSEAELERFIDCLYDSQFRISMLMRREH